MSTRAVYIFKDQYDTHCVYKHCDNYPTGAAEFIECAKALAWELPRFEADEFAASFVAANKNEGGGVSLTKSPKSHWDLEYIYEVSFNSVNAYLWVKAFESDGSLPTKLLYDGPQADFRAWAQRKDAVANEPPVAATWTRNAIKSVLESGIAIVQFKKADGTIRDMTCTLHPDYLPARANPPKRSIYTPSAKTMAVYEIGEGWKSFRLDNVIGVYLTQEGRAA